MVMPVSDDHSVLKSRKEIIEDGPVVGTDLLLWILGCTAETLRKWVRQAERDSGLRGGLTTAERQRVKELEREVRELKRTNEILRKASAYFAQAELDRRPR